MSVDQSNFEMAAIFYVLAIVLLQAIFTSQFTPFSECQDGLPPLEIRYDGCTEFPCKFRKNSMWTTNENNATVEFLMASDAKDLIIEAKSKIFGRFQTIVEQPNNCEHVHNASCPLKAGDIVVFKYKFTIPFYIPKQDADLRISLYNEKKELQTCFEVSTRII